MERGCNSPQHHAAGQWRDTNRTLSPDSWVLLCLLIMLSSAVPSISIDFKLTPTFLITEGKNSQEGSLRSALLESYRMVRANKGALLQRSPGWAHTQHHSQRSARCSQNASNLLQRLSKNAEHYHNVIETQKRGFHWMQVLQLPYMTTCLPPYHLLFWCQVLRFNPGWPNPTVQSDLMLVRSSSPYLDVLNSPLQELLTFANIKLLQASLVF